MIISNVISYYEGDETLAIIIVAGHSANNIIKKHEIGNWGERSVVVSRKWLGICFPRTEE